MPDIAGKYLTGLVIENYQRIKYIELEFDPKGQLIEVVSKNNAQGKSSLLNAVSRVFGGAKWDGPSPIHEGAERMMIKATLDDGTVITATEILNKEGKIHAQLIVKDARGLLYPKPQDALDKLYKTGLNPIEFFEWGKTADGRRKQVTVLLESAGLSGPMEEIDRKIATYLDSRKSANADVARIKGHLASLPVAPDDTPDEEVTLGQLQANLKSAQDWDVFLKNQNDALADMKEDLSETRLILADYEGQIQALHLKVKKLVEEAIPSDEKRIADAETEIAGLSPSFTADAEAAFTKADETNKLVRQKQARAKVEDELRMAQFTAGELDQQLEAARSKKIALVASAKFPVEHLGFDDDGVTLNGRPLASASEAEAIVLSTTLAIRMNPGLKCVPVRGASGLGEDMRLLIAKTAVDEGAQVILERIEKDDTVGIVISDGRVFRDNRKAKAEGQPALTIDAPEEEAGV